jgi:hypothetical protein
MEYCSKQVEHRKGQFTGCRRAQTVFVTYMSVLNVEKTAKLCNQHLAGLKHSLKKMQENFPVYEPNLKIVPIENVLTTKQPVEKSKVKEILGTRIFDEATILEIEKYVLSKQKPEEPQKFYNKLVDRLFHNIEHECLNRQALLFANTDCNAILNKLEQLAEVYNSFYGTCYTKQNIEFTVFYLEARKPEYVIRHFDKFHPIFLETYKKLLYLQSILQIKPLHSIYDVFTDFKIAIERQLMK